MTQHASNTNAAPAGGEGIACGGHPARALIVGLILAVPTGYILTYLATMPYQLGLFFFLVLGLFVGASMCRAGRGDRPVSKPTLHRLAIVVAAAAWFTVLVVEDRILPRTAAEFCRKQSLTSRMTDAELAAYQQRVAEEARAHIDAYRPGGVLGYVRWAVSSGHMSLPRAGASKPIDFVNTQRRIPWIVRVIFSLVLLFYGIDSQLVSIGPRPPADEESQGEQPSAGAAPT